MKTRVRVVFAAVMAAPDVAMAAPVRRWGRDAGHAGVAIAVQAAGAATRRQLREVLHGHVETT
jgi:hypothetical protein